MKGTCFQATVPLRAVVELHERYIDELEAARRDRDCIDVASWTASSAALLLTYEARAHLLASRSTPYWIELRDATLELCRALSSRAAAMCRVRHCRTRGRNAHVYLTFEDAE